MHFARNIRMFLVKPKIMLRNPKYLYLMTMGYTSGVPFLLILSTLSIRLSESGYDTKTIGIFTAVSIPYALKFLWAPYMDTLNIKIFTSLPNIKRYSLISIIGTMICLIMLGYLDIMGNLYFIGFFAFLTSFFAASFDITLDTMRIYSLDKKYVGIGAASETVGFRFGMLSAGAGAVYLSAVVGWSLAYYCMAASCMLGMISMLALPISESHFEVHKKTEGLGKILIESVKGLLVMPDIKKIIIFILSVKIAGTVMNALGAPFFLELGYSKTLYASVSKIYGVSLMLLGSVLGGILVQKKSITFTLKISLLLQGIAALLMMTLSNVGQNLSLLIACISIESFSSGILATGFISYISVSVAKPFVASQFTLLYSLGSLSRVVTSIVAGIAVTKLGWEYLFLLTCLTIVPAWMLIQHEQQA